MRLSEQLQEASGASKNVLAWDEMTKKQRDEIVMDAVGRGTTASNVMFDLVNRRGYAASRASVVSTLKRLVKAGKLWQESRMEPMMFLPIGARSPAGMQPR